MANNQRAEGGGTGGDELASRGDASKQAMYDTVLTTSVEVNGEPVRVRVGESIAIAHPESFVANNQRAEEGETDGVELACHGDASEEAISDATKIDHQTFEQEMNAFQNLVAYLNPSNPSSDALEELSPAPRDEGEGLSSHEGE